MTISTPESVLLAQQSACTNTKLFNSRIVTGSFPSQNSSYVCTASDYVSTWHYYAVGMPRIERLDNVTTTVLPSVTKVNIHSLANVTFYGALPQGLTTLNATNSTGNVAFMDTLPITTKTIIGGSGNNTFLLPLGYQNIPGLNVSCGGGYGDVVGIPDLTKLTPNMSNAFSNCEYIEIGGQASVTWSISHSNFTNTNAYLQGFSVMTALGGAFVASGVTGPATASLNNLYLGIAPAAAITIPTVTTMNIYIDDSKQLSKGGIKVANTLTFAAATTVNLFSYGSYNQPVSGSTVSPLYNTNQVGSSILTTVAAINLNVYGSKQLFIDATLIGATTLKNINASGMTGGGLWMHSIPGNIVTSIIGSAYNDTLKFNTGTVASTITATGGAGVNTINILTAAEISAANLANISGFTVLDVGSSNTQTYGTTIWSILWATNNKVNTVAIHAPLAGGACTLSNVMKEVDTLLISRTTSQAVSFAYASPSLTDTLTIVLDDSYQATAGAITLTTSFTAATLGVLNIVSNGSAANTVPSLLLALAQDVNISGYQSLTISAINAGATYNVNASGMSGSAALSLTTGTLTTTSGNTITGSNNADTITLGATVAARISIVGGGGADTINHASASTTGVISLVYNSQTDGGSDFRAMPNTSTTMLSTSGDQITGANSFTTTQDKFVISGDLREAVLHSQTGVTATASAWQSANTLNLLTSTGADASGILFLTGTAGTLNTLTKAQTISTVFQNNGVATNNALTSITNEAVGIMRILAINDTANTALYAYKCVTADNAITADEIVLLAWAANLSAVGDFIFG